MVFQPPQFIQSSFSINFPRQLLIRRKINEIEDLLIHQYNQPQSIPVPDDMDPGAPRFFFESKDGHNQIVVSQVNMSLNFQCPTDEQEDFIKATEYLEERAPILFDLARISEVDRSIHYCGNAATVRLPSRECDQEIISRIANAFQLKRDEEELHDIEIKKTLVYEQKYFSNITVRNFRAWQFPVDLELHELRAHPNFVVERGLEILGDFNDRFRYNQDASYYSSREEVRRLLDQGVSGIRSAIDHIRG